MAFKDNFLTEDRIIKMAIKSVIDDGYNFDSLLAFSSKIKSMGVGEASPITEVVGAMTDACKAIESESSNKNVKKPYLQLSVEGVEAVRRDLIRYTELHINRESRGCTFRSMERQVKKFGKKQLCRVGRASSIGSYSCYGLSCSDCPFYSKL